MTKKVEIEQKEIASPYALPDGWQDRNNCSFDELAESVEQLHKSSLSSAVKAVNRIATVRNYVIGFYIVEYEQHGKDRAEYGSRLIKNLAEKINQKGLNETLLKNCRRFYLLYPQLKEYLQGISPTVSDFSTPCNNILEKLSFSHIVEIMTVDDKLARFFYETECIKCCWSVQELRRQISTNLFFRSGISKNPEKLLVPSTSPDASLTIKDPFTFEFLGLRAEAFTESDLENALITHLQEFLLELGKGFCFALERARKWWNTRWQAWTTRFLFRHICLHCPTQRLSKTF